MATNNPKVSAYVPQAIYDKVMELKVTRGYASVSMALTAALEEYFGLSKERMGTPHDTTVEKLENLEGKLLA
jgi:hypothetical protein